MTARDRWSTRRLMLLCAVAGGLLGACELRVALDVVVGRSGSGTVELAVGLDEELAGLVEDSGVDPLRGLDALADRAEPWTVETTVPTEPGIELRFRAPFDDPEEFADLTDDLQSALGPEDGRLFERLRITRRDDGRIEFDGQVGLIPPEAPGATGAGVSFDVDDLARLVDERGDEFVRYDLRVTLPAAPERHDADEVVDASLSWRAPVGELRAVSALSLVPSAPSVLVAVGVGAASAVATATVVVLVRRRRSRRRVAPVSDLSRSG